MGLWSETIRFKSQSYLCLTDLSPQASPIMSEVHSLDLERGCRHPSLLEQAEDCTDEWTRFWMVPGS